MADRRQPAPAAVVQWLLTGASETQIEEALKAEYPRARSDQVMLTVQQHLAAAGSPDRDAVRGWALLSYRQLYQKLLEVGDYDGARKVIREITLLTK